MVGRRILMEHIKTINNAAICRLESISDVTAEFVQNLQWEQGIEKMAFFFKKPLANEWEVLNAISLQDKAWVIYSIERTKLTGADAGGNHFIITELPDEKELADIILSSRENYYRSIGRELSPRQVLEQRGFLEKGLSRTRRMCVKKGGIAVALIMLVENTDLNGDAVDWIPWVWVDGLLMEEERGRIHGFFREWLKGGSLPRIQCSVASYNARSQKFFRKMGFNPECVQILKG